MSCDHCSWQDQWLSPPAFCFFAAASNVYRGADYSSMIFSPASPSWAISSSNHAERYRFKSWKHPLQLSLLLGARYTLLRSERVSLIDRYPHQRRFYLFLFDYRYRFYLGWTWRLPEYKERDQADGLQLPWWFDATITLQRDQLNRLYKGFEKRICQALLHSFAYQQRPLSHSRRVCIQSSSLPFSGGSCWRVAFRCPNSITGPRLSFAFIIAYLVA